MIGLSFEDAEDCVYLILMRKKKELLCSCFCWHRKANFNEFIVVVLRGILLVLRKTASGFKVYY